MNDVKTKRNTYYSGHTHFELYKDNWYQFQIEDHRSLATSKQKQEYEEARSDLKKTADRWNEE